MHSGELPHFPVLRETLLSLPDCSILCPPCARIDVVPLLLLLYSLHGCYKTSCSPYQSPNPFGVCIPLHFTLSIVISCIPLLPLLIPRSVNHHISVTPCSVVMLPYINPPPHPFVLSNLWLLCWCRREPILLEGTLLFFVAEASTPLTIPKQLLISQRYRSFLTIVKLSPFEINCSFKTQLCEAINHHLHSRVLHIQGNRFTNSIANTLQSRGRTKLHGNPEHANPKCDLRREEVRLLRLSSS